MTYTVSSGTLNPSVTIPSHIFQQKLMHLYQTMTLPWRSFSDSVFANNKRSCLLISASEFRWRVQPTAARRSDRFSKMHGALRTLHVSLNISCMRTIIYCPQTTEKEQWPPYNSPPLTTMEISCLGSMHEAILKPSYEAQNSFSIKSRTGEDMRQCSAGPIKKLFRVLEIV